MLVFTFLNASGVTLYTYTATPREKDDGGRCFDEAVAHFRANVMPEFVPGQPGIEIIIKGFSNA